MLIPSEVRRKIDPQRDGEAFYVVFGEGGRLFLYPERYYEQLVSRDPRELTPDADTLAYDRLNLGLANRIEWDKQGRVLLPDRMLKEAGVAKEVTLLGVRDHLELWNRDEWELEREQLEARRAELSLKARQARQAPPP
jgi:MraZ protein